ncbi:MAG: hypothetical protein QXU40_00665 [Candidatus Pacearchaeota archaeon]
MKKRNKDIRKKISLLEIIILVVSIISFSYIISQELAQVSAGVVGAVVAAGKWVAGAVVSVISNPITWVVVGIIVIMILLNNINTIERDVWFTCKPWQAPSGGDNCERCNEGPFPCTEYQCRSLGTACRIINKDTPEQKCKKIDRRGGARELTINPWNGALIAGSVYEPLPANRGVWVKYNPSSAPSRDGCYPSYMPFTFGVELDDEGYCKLDFNRTDNFSSMRFDFGGSNLYKRQHKQWIVFPGAFYIEEEARINGLNVSVGNEYEIYVRCKSAQGVENRQEFLFKFCVEREPDRSAPTILGFNLRDRSYIGWFDVGSPREINITLYTNKPAACRWSREDKDYDSMENNMTKSDLFSSYIPNIGIPNQGKLTGLVNEQENTFYFRCRDPYFNTTNMQSKTLTLIGTQRLYIYSITPTNGTTIKGGTSPTKVTFNVETAAGANRGESVCEYKQQGEKGGYIRFSQTGTHIHSTNLWLTNGNYIYSIRCIDAAGNSDTKTISFYVEVDTKPPSVVRVFREAQNLKIITDENATCVYGTYSCEYNFEDGISMNSNNIFHTTAWNPNMNLYIKCEDAFENKPIPNQCSIIVRPFEV